MLALDLTQKKKKVRKKKLTGSEGVVYLHWLNVFTFFFLFTKPLSLPGAKEKKLHGYFLLYKYNFFSTPYTPKLLLLFFKKSNVIYNVD